MRNTGKVDKRVTGSMKNVWKENGVRKRLCVHVKRKMMSQTK